jgi:o-succinylbenzoate synthase
VRIVTHCRIVDARVSAYCRKLVRPLVTSAGSLAERRGFLLRLDDVDGFAGYGEASPVWWAGGESLAATQAELTRLCSAVRAPGFDWEAHAATCPPAVAAALGCAVLDLTARRHDTSVARAINPEAAAVVETNALATAENLTALAEETERALAQGFRSLKLKVGAGALENDLAKLRAIRTVTRGRLMLRLDANQAWDLETARRFCSSVADADIDYVEEPLRTGSPTELAALRTSASVRIALDESVSTLPDLERYAQAGSCDVVVLKLARIGTPHSLVELAARASNARMQVTVTDSLESEIGQRIAVHMAAAIRTASATGLAGRALLADGEPQVRSQPYVEVAGPGLGLSDRAIARAWDGP